MHIFNFLPPPPSLPPSLNTPPGRGKPRQHYIPRAQSAVLRLRLRITRVATSEERSFIGASQRLEHGVLSSVILRWAVPVARIGQSPYPMDAMIKTPMPDQNLGQTVRQYVTGPHPNVGNQPQRPHGAVAVHTCNWNKI